MISNEQMNDIMKILQALENCNMILDIYMFGYLRFVDFMLAAQTSLDYKVYFHLMILKKNDNIILSYF